MQRLRRCTPTACCTSHMAGITSTAARRCRRSGGSARRATRSRARRPRSPSRRASSSRTWNFGSNGRKTVGAWGRSLAAAGQICRRMASSGRSISPGFRHWSAATTCSIPSARAKTVPPRSSSGRFPSAFRHGSASCPGARRAPVKNSRFPARRAANAPRSARILMAGRSTCLSPMQRSRAEKPFRRRFRQAV